MFKGERNVGQFLDISQYTLGSTNWHDSLHYNLSVLTSTAFENKKRPSVRYITTALTSLTENKLPTSLAGEKIDTQQIYMRSIVQMRNVLLAESFDFFSVFDVVASHLKSLLKNKPDGWEKRVGIVELQLVDVALHHRDRGIREFTKKQLQVLEGISYIPDLTGKDRALIEEQEMVEREHIVRRYAAGYLVPEGFRNLTLASSMVEDVFGGISNEIQQERLFSAVEQVFKNHTNKDDGCADLLYHLDSFYKRNDTRPELPSIKKLYAMYQRLQSLSFPKDKFFEKLADYSHEYSSLFAKKIAPTKLVVRQPLRREQQLVEVLEKIAWSEAQKLQDLPYVWTTFKTEGREGGISYPAWNTVFAYIQKNRKNPDVMEMFAGETTKVHAELWAVPLNAARSVYLPYIRVMDEQGKQNTCQLDLGQVEAGEQYDRVYRDMTIPKHYLPDKADIEGGYKITNFRAEYRGDNEIQETDRCTTTLEKIQGPQKLKIRIDPYLDEIEATYEHAASTSIREIQVHLVGENNFRANSRHHFALTISTKNSRFSFDSGGKLFEFYSHENEGNLYHQGDFSQEEKNLISQVMQQEVGMIFDPSKDCRDIQQVLVNIVANCENAYPKDPIELLALQVRGN